MRRCYACVHAAFVKLTSQDPKRIAARWKVVHVFNRKRKRVLCRVVCVRDFCAMMTVKLVGEKETISSAAAAMKSEGLSSIICTPTLFNMVSC